MVRLGVSNGVRMGTRGLCTAPAASMCRRGPVQSSAQGSEPLESEVGHLGTWAGFQERVPLAKHQ